MVIRALASRLGGGANRPGRNQAGGRSQLPEQVRNRIEERIREAIQNRDPGARLGNGATPGRLAARLNAQA